MRARLSAAPEKIDFVQKTGAVRAADPARIN
jgi:hypothetical protein